MSRVWKYYNFEHTRTDNQSLLRVYLCENYKITTLYFCTWDSFSNEMTPKLRNKIVMNSRDLGFRKATF